MTSPLRRAFLAAAGCLVTLGALPGVGQSPIADKPTDFSLGVASTGATTILVELPDDVARLVRASPDWAIEAPDTDLHRAAFVREEPAEGRRCALLAGDQFVGDAQVSLIQPIASRLASGEAYVISLQYRGQVDRFGEATVEIERQTQAGAPWQALAHVRLQPNALWREAHGELIGVDGGEVRLRLTLKGQGRLFADEVSLAERRRPDINLLTDPGFEGSYHWSLRYRPEGSTDWVDSPAVIHESRHSIIGLRPESLYEVQADLISAAGRRVGGSQIVRAQTGRQGPRAWQELLLAEPRRLELPHGAFPSVEAYGDRVYVVYADDSRIMLAELTTRLAVLGLRELLPAPGDDAKAWFQGQPQTCLYAGRLYVAFKRDCRPFIRSARLYVAALDLATGELMGPREVVSNHVDRRPWNGGITEVGGRLYVGYADTRVERDIPFSQIVVREVHPDTLQAYPVEARLDPGPSPHPYSPMLATFDEYVVVLFSDMAEEYGPKGRVESEPLYCCLFDGRRFTDPVPISTQGRNRYGRALQVGRRLLVAWKSSASYGEAEWGDYMFHDIVLALVDPIARTVETTTYVADVKYNASPDLVRMGDEVVVVHSKHEHRYGLADDPAEPLGLWAGRIGLRPDR